MKHTLQQHITGDDLSDALMILQQLADAQASGSLKTSSGFIRLYRGRVMKVADGFLAKLIAGGTCDWGWRAVTGRPNGDLDFVLYPMLIQALGGN